MRLIRCTKKLQTEMGLRKQDLVDNPGDETGLGDWYAHLIRVGRAKTVLFVSETTLLCVPVIGVKSSQLRDLGALLRENLRRVLEIEGVPAEIAENFVASYAAVAFAPTASRRVLGQINDISANLQFEATRQDDHAPGSFAEIVISLNDTPMGSMGYAFPSERLKQLYMH